MRRIAILAAVVALALPGAAFAQGSSTCQAYNPQLCTSVSANTSKLSSGSSTLPFTGLDIVLIAAGGVSLLAAGVAVRRFTRLN